MKYEIAYFYSIIKISEGKYGTSSEKQGSLNTFFFFFKHVAYDSWEQTAL